MIKLIDISNIKIKNCPGIYKIYNIINNMFYIGSSSRIRDRWYGHYLDLKNGTHTNRYLQNAWNKYGEEYFYVELIENPLKEDLLSREQYWLDITKCYERVIGYNISRVAGSPMRGLKASDDTRRKMSLIRTGKRHLEESKKKIGEANRRRECKPISEETRLRLSKAASGKNNPMYGKKLSKESMDRKRKTMEDRGLWKKKSHIE